MRRIAVVSLAVVAVLLVGSQIVIPPVAEREVRDRLEEHGGHADVSVSAFPALRLLAGDGSSLEASGTGIRVDLAPEDRPLERLDGFDRVKVALTDSAAGPIALDRLRLVRQKGERAYRLRVAGRTTPREVARFLGSRAAGPLGALFGAVGASQLPGGGRTELPVRLRAMLESHDGRVDVTTASGSVAGLPAEPLAELVMAAVAQRL